MSWEHLGDMPADARLRSARLWQRDGRALAQPSVMDDISLVNTYDSSGVAS